MKARRNSSIELLKILAILFIIINHVTQTAGMTINEYVSFPLSYGVDLTSATCDFQTFLLIIFRRFGALGNDIFLICSIWFLLGSQRISSKKLSDLICETWFISVIIMLLFVLWGVKLKPSLIIRSLLPTTYCNNWYITAYLLLYAIHPTLNYVVTRLKKRMHMITVLVLFVLYSILGTLNNDFWYYTHFMYFVMVYILMAFLKKYIADKPNVFYLKMLISVISAQLACILVVNIMGLYVGVFDHRMMMGAKTSNPFCLAIAIFLFYIIKKKPLDNVVINYISKLSLLIYLVHENILVRLIARPFAWNLICERYGIDHRVLMVLIVSLLIFAISLIICMVYKFLLQKFVYTCSDIINKEICSAGRRILTVLKIYND